MLKYAQQYNSLHVVTGPAYDYNYDGRFDSREQIERYDITSVSHHTESKNNNHFFSMFVFRWVTGTSLPVPTHYFAVLTSCVDVRETVSECSTELQTLSFLMPHREENSESCTVSTTHTQTHTHNHHHACVTTCVLIMCRTISPRRSGWSLSSGCTNHASGMSNGSPD